MRSRTTRRAGFTLVELAVVMAVIALLLSGLMFSLSAQTEQRTFEENRRLVEQARDLLLSFAIVNGRLPCPARSTSAGAEVRDASGNCTSGGVDDYYGGPLTGGATGGYLPAQTIGYPRTDSDGFALDAWQGRIRYAVAKNNTNCSVTPPANTRLFTHKLNLKTYGLSCQPNDLIVCKSATGMTSSACGGSANQVMTSDLVVAVVFSTGKNGATTLGGGADEQANLNITSTGTASIDPVFVFHTPTPSGATNGEFDDYLLWVTVGEFYGKLIGAGVLP
jgi:prepilin-type N-terminal cleavage/methylation domain-containing protein